jgi:hypothetical protein
VHHVDGEGKPNLRKNSFLIDSLMFLIVVLSMGALSISLIGWCHCFQGVVGNLVHYVGLGLILLRLDTLSLHYLLYTRYNS